MHRTPRFLRGQILAGCAVFAAGIAGMLGLIPALADYTYAIVWWGLLAVIDAWNSYRRGVSLWFGRERQFLLITVPASVLLWLLFELLNLAAPQWRYHGGVESIAGQVLFGFAAFATVIPIVVEGYWLIAEVFCVPHSLRLAVRDHRLLIPAAGCILLSAPAYNKLFWFNQGIWLAPALLLVPFVPLTECDGWGRFLLRMAVTGLVAGFFWECLNFWARTHWEYLILPNAPHLFAMPLAGYLGFIPFAFTVLAFYEWLARIRPRVFTGICLYSAAFAGLYVLTVIYVKRGLWISP